MCLVLLFGGDTLLFKLNYKTSLCSLKNLVNSPKDAMLRVFRLYESKEIKKIK